MKKALSILTAAVMSCCAVSVPATSASSTEYPLYDMNLDGDVDLSDVYTLFTYYQEIQIQKETTLSPERYAKCQADGDLSGDGFITAYDASLLFKICSDQAILGDVDCSGMITASDAAYILSYSSLYATGALEEALEKYDFKSWALRQAGVNGDLNADGRVTGADASLALNAYADYMSNYPIG